MRLDFNILWIDDQQRYVRSQQRTLERIIRKEGFQLEVEFIESVEQAVEFLKEESRANHVDLILMDYNLGQGKMGDVGLKEIREFLPYKEIIFYSANTDDKNTDIGDILRNSGVQGVYSTNRDDIPLVVEEIFLVLIKKVIDIEHSRGIAMGATSDIDELVNECLILVFNNADYKRKTDYFQQIFSSIEKIEKRFSENIDDARKITTVEDLHKHHLVYTSNDRIKLLKNILKTLGKYPEEQHSDLDKKIGQYMNEILPRRNELAHVRVQIEGFSRKIFTKKGLELTPLMMKQLRIDLLVFRELMEKLKADLTPNSEVDSNQ